MNFPTLKNNWTVWSLFIFLLGYLVIRIIYVGPYLDEAFTFLDYIELNELWQESLNERSANNHLLTTYLGAFFYKCFGYSIIWLRIPSVIAFCIYFFATRRLVLKGIHEKYQLIVFIALNTIAWIFEYFGYLRGYGLAIALILSAVVYLINYFEHKKLRQLILVFVLLWLSVFANLAYFNSVIIVAFCVAVFLIAHIKSLKTWHLIAAVLLFLAFVFSLLPLVNYSFELKEAGALWWGNLSGIWNVTGSTLSELTFFRTGFLIKCSVAITIVFLAILGLVSAVKNGFISYLLSIEGIFFTLFFGNIILIEFLAIFFEVNYPRDRTAMHLVIILLYLFSSLVQRLNGLNYLLLALLFFPISFLFKLTPYSSVYQKNYRISYPVSQYLEKHINDRTSYGVFTSIQPSLNLELRKHNPVLLYNDNHYFPSHQPEYLFIDRLEDKQLIPSYYKLEVFDENSGTAVYKDQRKHKEIIVKQNEINSVDFGHEYFGLIEDIELKKTIGNYNFKLRVTGQIESMEQRTPLFLCYSLGDSVERNRASKPMSLDQVVNNFGNVDFVWNSPIFSPKVDSPLLLLYLWNKDKKIIRIKNIKVVLYKVL